MAIDPILAAHFIQNNVFEIGGQFSPASVRDQMVRAYLLVDRALQQGIIGPKKRLLVIGAGSTGVTAGIRAAQLGVDTTIIEQRPNHAFLLGRCRTRDVEPTLYDWPVAHSDEHQFEWTGAAMPLRWRSLKANLIALHWQQVFARALHAYAGNLQIRFGTRVAFTSGVRAAPLTLLTPLGPQVDNFGGVISCVGWGRENCNQGSFHGLEFWENDDIQAPHFGLAPRPSPRILISGGGDGALQDVIRVMTAKSAKEVFEQIRKPLQATPDALSQLEHKIQSAEDVAGRALSWSLPPQDQPIFERLEREQTAAIHDLRLNTATWSNVCQTVQDLVRDPVPNLTLIHRGSVFTQSYPLNRFIVLLLLEVLGQTFRVKDAELQTVTCAHNPPTSAQQCYGHPHDVTYLINGSSVSGQFDIVMIRHGVLGPRGIVSGPGPAHTRQILPYFVEV